MKRSFVIYLLVVISGPVSAERRLRKRGNVAENIAESWSAVDPNGEKGVKCQKPTLPTPTLSSDKKKKKKRKDLPLCEDEGDENSATGESDGGDSDPVYEGDENTDREEGSDATEDGDGSKTVEDGTGSDTTGDGGGSATASDGGESQNSYNGTTVDQGKESAGDEETSVTASATDPEFETRGAELSTSSATKNGAIAAGTVAAVGLVLSVLIAIDRKRKNDDESCQYLLDQSSSSDEEIPFRVRMPLETLSEDQELLLEDESSYDKFAVIDELSPSSNAATSFGSRPYVFEDCQDL